MAIAERKVLVNVGFYSEFPKKLADAKDIVSEGAVGFKLFMGCQIGGLNIDDDQDLAGCIQRSCRIKCASGGAC